MMLIILREIDSASSHIDGNSDRNPMQSAGLSVIDSHVGHSELSRLAIDCVESVSRG